MAALVVIDVVNAPRKLLGQLQRLMLEVRPGTFVWRLPSIKVRELWEEIQKHDCSALCIYAAKNETGFVMATHGKSRREVVQNHGIQLIRYTKTKTDKSGDF